MTKRGFIRKGRFFVYIVKCRDNSFYTGFTPDLKRRVKLHNAGRGAKYTRDRRPVKLVWHKEYKYFKLAFMEERRIKTFTRAQKENLVKSAKKARRKIRRASKKRHARVAAP
jgi:putative endonuclease